MIMKLLIYVSGAGGWVGLEHPRDPGREPFPSFWPTWEMSFFLEAITGYRVNLHQCMYGSSAVLPTTIASNDCSVSSLVRCCRHVVPHTAVIAASDLYKSQPAAAARYPHDLTPALAGRFVAWWVGQLQIGGRTTGIWLVIPWAARLYNPELISDIGSRRWRDVTELCRA